MERKILPGLEKKALGMSLLALAAVPVILVSSCTVRRAAGLSPVAAMNRQAMVEASRADLGLLTWPEQLDAVRYELELLDGIPLNLDPAREADHALYRNSRVYSAQALLPLEELRKKQTTGVLYYRVRAFDLDGRPLGNYSQPAAVESSLRKVERNAPVPRSRMEDTNGSLLLYPVYAYTGNPGAVQYEVEVTDRMPENPEGTAPSRYRVFAQVNAYIRSRDHIDVAASFENGGDLPTELALDGIHGDWNMKQELAQVINEGMKRFGVQES